MMGEIFYFKIVSVQDEDGNDVNVIDIINVDLNVDFVNKFPKTPIPEPIPEPVIEPESFYVPSTLQPVSPKIENPFDNLKDGHTLIEKPEQPTPALSNDEIRRQRLAYFEKLMKK